MNHLEIEEFARFFGVSPFSVMGVQLGDLFTHGGTFNRTKYRFVGVSTELTNVGIFQVLCPSTGHELPRVIMRFKDVVPVEPFRVKWEDLHELPRTE